MKTTHEKENDKQRDGTNKFRNENLLSIRHEEFRMRVEKMARESGRKMGYYVEWCLERLLPTLERMHEAEQRARDLVETRRSR